MSTPWCSDVRSGRTVLRLAASVAVLTGLSFLQASCKTGTEPRSSAVAVVLRISHGISGTPAGSDSIMVDSGEVVSYSYNAATRFRNPTVLLDGASVALSGQFVAVHRHVLSATADSEIVAPSDSGMLRTSRALLTAADPYAAYLQFEQQADSLRAVVGDMQAIERLRAIEVQSFDPVRDAAAVATAIHAIAESLWASGTSRAVMRRTRLEGSVPEVVFVYVNGINTSLSDFLATETGAAATLVSVAGFTDAAKYNVAGFYNPSVRTLSLANLAALFCYQQKAALLAALQLSRLISEPACNAGDAGDLVESVLQVANATFGFAPGSDQPDVLSFASYLEGFLSSGTRVVILAHSQGNLYAQQALAAIRDGTLASLVGCIATVGIAPPTSNGWPVGASSVEQLIAQGGISEDILLQLPVPNTLAERPSTLRTNWWDQQWYYFLPFYGLVAPIAGIDIHGFYNYAYDPSVQRMIASDLVNQEYQSRRNCPFAAALVATSGDGQIAPAGSSLPLPVVVEATDGAGNGVSGIGVTFTVTLGAGQVGGGSSLVVPTDPSGKASAVWLLGPQSGLNQLQATAQAQNGSPLSGSPVTFTATATSVAAYQITKVSGDGQLGAVNAALAQPLVVEVDDGSGNPVSGVQVDFGGIASGGGSVQPTSAVTNGQGRAQTTWTMGPGAGNFTVTATIHGTTTSVVFAASTVRQFGVVSGNNQTGTAGQALAQPLVVQLTEANGTPISGATVTWAVTAGGGSVGAASTQTDAQGHAQTTWTLGQSGTQTLTATLSLTANGSPVTFGATVAVSQGLPDLVPAALTLPDTFQFSPTNLLVPYALTICNRGSGTVGPNIPYAWFWSSDSTQVFSSGWRFSTSAPGSVGPGQCTTDNWYVEGFSGSSGVWFLGVELDNEGTIQESDRSNNFTTVRRLVVR